MSTKAIARAKLIQSREREKNGKGGPDLPPPAMSASRMAAASTGAILGSENVRDEIIQALAKVGIKTKHVGGALPPLFRDDPKQGDAAMVKYLGYEIVGADRSGTENGFTSLRFDVIDFRTLTVTHRASMPMAAVMSTFFETEIKTVELTIDGKKKTVEEEHPTIDPDTCPLLVITFGGTGPQKKAGRNPAKMWVIEACPEGTKLSA